MIYSWLTLFAELAHQCFLTLLHNIKLKVTCNMCHLLHVCISCRSKPLGYVSVTSLLLLASSMTSRPRSSSKTHWSSGQPGWREWYTPSWSRTREEDTSSPRLQGSSFSSGLFTGTYIGQCSYILWHVLTIECHYFTRGRVSILYLYRSTFWPSDCESSRSQVLPSFTSLAVRKSNFLFMCGGSLGTKLLEYYITGSHLSKPSLYKSANRNYIFCSVFSHFSHLNTFRFQSGLDKSS